MLLNEFKVLLTKSLIGSCGEVILNLPKEIPDKSIYAFSIYCASGCTSFGVAFSTVDFLKEKNKELASNDSRALLNKMNAAEWSHVNFGYGFFQTADRLANDFYDCLYDGDFDDFRIDPKITSKELSDIASDAFVDSISNALLKMKNNGVFFEKRLVDDSLLGLQFGSPGPRELKMMEAVSSSVNSVRWHDEVVRNCSLIRNLQAN